jgi:hypothetical protein
MVSCSLSGNELIRHNVLKVFTNLSRRKDLLDLFGQESNTSWVPKAKIARFGEQSLFTDSCAKRLVLCAGTMIYLVGLDVFVPSCVSKPWFKLSDASKKWKTNTSNPRSQCDGKLSLSPALLNHAYAWQSGSVARVTTAIFSRWLRNCRHVREVQVF